jgi:hypothetical protein
MNLNCNAYVSDMFLNVETGVAIQKLFWYSDARLAKVLVHNHN